MQSTTVNIIQESAKLSQKSTEIYTNLILLLPAGFDRYETLPHGQVLHARMQRQGEKIDAGAPFASDLPNAAGTRVALALIDPGADAHALLTLARKLVDIHAQGRHATLAIACYGFEHQPALADAACEAVVAATLASDFALPMFKSKPQPRSALREIHIHGHRRADGYARTRAEAAGNNLARYFTALPANELTPAHYRTRVEKLAKAQGWKSEFLNLKKLRALGAGAFVAVAQGSPDEDAGILHLRYSPTKKARVRSARTKSAAQPPGLALVGKGICFDTGGTNLKTAKGMYGMHEDMEGSAVALGTLLALTELRVDFPVDCWLALAQNHIGPKAYRPNEVVTAANGTTIEIVHTDAEGRMVLADTLHLACAHAPSVLIDYATLTGACIHALGTIYSGAFTNRPALVPTLIAAGQASGERVWPFPLDADYADELKSDIADIKQCTLGGEADHILAAVFLKRFLAGDPAWVHIDLAAGKHKGGLAHIPTDVTGFGVRFSLNLLLDQELLGRS
jgi:leucyl aminopeptidase